jgi:VWFA-related protein
MKQFSFSLKAALAVAAILAVPISVPVASQSSPQKPSAGNPTVQTQPLRVTSRLVQVNVIVEDKNGRPITGLTKKDFMILDQGQPQTIASMSEQTIKLTSSVDTLAAPAPNFYSNRFQERYGVPPSVSVILLDALNTSRPNMTYARAQVVKFLRQLQPQDRVALYGLSDKIYILHDFTADTEALQRAMSTLPRLQQDQANATAPMDFAVATGDAVVDAWAASVVQAGADFNTINRVEQTAYALEAIANHLASLPGRKNLIWISGSFPFQIGMGSIGGTAEQRSFGNEVESAARALSNANVAIYPIDARGLVASRGGRGTAGPDVDSMVVLADRTGGRAFYNTNDITGAIHRAIDDSRVTYVLNYYPNHNQWDGRFREIKVKVNRPGVEVRSRRGYFAFANVVVSHKDKEAIMVDAAKSPLESTALGMDVQADPVDVPGAREIKAQVKIDPSQLQLTRTGDHWTDSIEVKWVQLSADGNVLASSSQTLDLNIPQADYESVLRKGLSFSGAVNLVNDATDVRLVARDSGNGSVGTVNIPVARLFVPTAVQ